MYYRNHRPNQQRLSPALGLSLMLCTVISASIGCSPAELRRQAVEGQVTLNGKPVSDLLIIFLPEDPKGHGATGLVADGRFFIEQERGPSVGRHDVLFEKVEPELEEFESLRDAGQRPLSTIRLAPRFTRPGAFEVEIKLEVAEPLEFQLTSR